MTSTGGVAPCALGLDVGGTAARWRLVDAHGVVAGGSTAGFSGAMLHTATGREEVRSQLQRIASQVGAAVAPPGVTALVAGVTGVGGGSEALVSMLAEAFALPARMVTVVSDIEIAYRAAFAPDGGYLVYAGTGSIAAFIDAAGVLHRAGGRGFALDDAGGGYWIGREALRRLWRREDEQPGAWRESALARRLFAVVGGDSSIHSARFLMERGRGEIGMLAIDVAACAGFGAPADGDEIASAIMLDAGAELARLAIAMIGRFGPKRIVVAGRAAQLHPLIEAGMRGRMPVDTALEFRNVEADRAAAALAWQRAVSGGQQPNLENR